MEVALDRLPAPKALVGLGIDRPLYASVHSAVADLAPKGHALIHLARYGGTRGRDPRTVAAELETLLDLLQPGWRDHVVEKRFLPELIVSNALVTAETGGRAGRPGPAVPDIPGLFVAGDWVGPEGMLADAALASARRAAREILENAHRADRAAVPAEKMVGAFR
jgi:phytoene dehydrogenase-like protein